MRQVEPLELGLWEVLKEAAIAPDEADLGQLLDGLDAALLELNTVGQLQVAAEAIAQIAQVFCDRSSLAFEELEATNSDQGPVMPTDAFDRYVQQTMEVDFDQFIEPLATLPRKSPERRYLTDEHGSVVGELDKIALLQALDEQINQNPGLTETEAFNRVMELAYEEDVAGWTKEIAQWMDERQVTTLSLVQLQQSIGMPLIQLWLTLLLGGYEIEQRGDFYETEQIWVLGRY